MYLNKDYIIKELDVRYFQVYSPDKSYHLYSSRIYDGEVQRLVIFQETIYFIESDIKVKDTTAFNNKLKELNVEKIVVE